MAERKKYHEWKKCREIKKEDKKKIRKIKRKEKKIQQCNKQETGNNIKKGKKKRWIFKRVRKNERNISKENKNERWKYSKNRIKQIIQAKKKGDKIKKENILYRAK